MATAVELNEERHDVRGDGRIILYKREGLKSPKWQARIRVPNANGYKIVTTKTDNLREAERLALDLYEDLYLHVKSGGSVQSKTFKQVFDEWKKHVTALGHTRRGGSWDSTIDRVETYALKFFGPKKVDGIGPTDFADFWVWRKSNFNRKAPSNGTLRRERTCLLPVFKFALSRGYIQAMPDTDPPKAAVERRPTFTQDEWRKIYTKARTWVKEGESLATHRQRYMTQQYILVLANTGLRVGELRGLRWSDLRTVKTTDGTRLVAEVRFCLQKIAQRQELGGWNWRGFALFQPAVEDHEADKHSEPTGMCHQQRRQKQEAEHCEHFPRSEADGPAAQQQHGKREEHLSQPPDSKQQTRDQDEAEELHGNRLAGSHDK